MIITRQPRIPFRWLLMTMVPWVFFYFLIQVNGVNFFVLNRLIDNPAALTFALSLPGLVFVFIPLGPYIAYKSDRIWTRWGRRKIFLIIGFSGMAFVLVTYPLAPNIWVFLGLMFLGSFFGNFNAPFEALKLEIIPPFMRGRSAAIGTWITTVINILFWMMIIGRFDEVIPFLDIPLSGDKIIFWSASAGLIIALFIYAFGIRELPPHSALTGEKFNFKTMWNSLTTPQLRYLYIFSIASVMLAANLGALGQLLYINQWGYNLQEMGFNVAVGGVINLFLIPAVGLLADKGKGHNRMRIWITCLVLILLLNIAYFSYVTWYLPDQRPSLVEIIFFGEITCVVGIVAGVVYYPLVYDYIPRNLMGTYFAGTSILGGLFGFLSVNGLGLFMLAWASLFQPPAGQMARVCLEKEASAGEIAGVLTAAQLSTPDNSPVSPDNIVVHPWFANGIVQETGTCMEIRLRDPIGEKMRSRQETLKKKIDALEAKGRDGNKQKITALRKENDTLVKTLTVRSDNWSEQVLQALKGKLILPGHEALAYTEGQSTNTLLPTLRKAREREIDKLNRTLRAESPNFIGLRIVNRGRDFFILVSSLLPYGEEQGNLLEPMCKRVIELAGTTAPGLIASDALHSAPFTTPALTADIILVEDPQPTFMSPISRAVNRVLSLFTEIPAPDQKLITLARSLSGGEDFSNARVDALPSVNGLRVTKVSNYETQNELSTRIACLVDKVRTAGTSLKLTVPIALVDKGAVPIRYNYLAGYLYVFLMVLGGFVLVAFFLIKEKAGIVRKLGAEEVENEKAAAEENKRKADAEALAMGIDSPIASHHTYTPGHLIPKVLFAILGLAMVFIALQQSWPHLRLLTKGASAEAVAVSVRVEKPGQSTQILSNQADLDAKIKAVSTAKDYQWTFYNDYNFETKDGHEVTFRREVGCKLKPSMPLIDANGLPATAKLLYDPANPAIAVLPMEFSSWFVPGLVGAFGFIAFLVGVTLAWYARRPIPIIVE
ncbi:MAG: MFS transporter [Verrucomicrobiota bacterium]|nr:MFS transporter [Verrucomicrobiota bacterium]